MLAALQLVGEANVPLNWTVLLPCAAPKFDPEIVTNVPARPQLGDRPLITGPVTVKFAPLLVIPETVIATLPDVAPEGTWAVTVLLFHVSGIARMPLNCTVLVPCVAPKFEPVMTTVDPTRPAVGDKETIVGGGEFGASIGTGSEAVTVPAATTISVVPKLTPQTKPLLPTALLIVATSGIEELHVTD
jgi:hypothetical protein